VSRGLRRPTLGTGAITPTEVVPWVPVTPVEVGPDLVGGNKQSPDVSISSGERL
jgi:hypothetical protein